MKFHTINYTFATKIDAQDYEHQGKALHIVNKNNGPGIIAPDKPTLKPVTSNKMKFVSIFQVFLILIKTSRLWKSIRIQL